MRRRSFVVAVLLASGAVLSLPGTATASFGFLPGSEGFSIAAEEQDGTAATQAGAHPYAFEADIGLHTTGVSSDGDLRDLHLHLPPGLLINPSAAGECTALAFATPRVSPYEASASGESCPDNSQVGVIAVNAGGTVRHFGLFSLTPPFGTLAAIGASPFGAPLVFDARLRESDYGLDLGLEGLQQSLDLQSMRVTIWGAEPWAGEHDTERGNCLNEVEPSAYHGSCSIGTPAYLSEWAKSYLTLPASPCGTPPSFSASADSWQGDSASATTTIPALEHCSQPLTTAQLRLMTEDAATRTGLAFQLDVTDGFERPTGIARPAIKEAIVSLPQGLTVNPSVGSGLGTCTEAQFAAEAATSEPGAGCPGSSKIGTTTLEGALGLSGPVNGSLYVAQPFQNPFHTLLAVYMLARLPRRGVIVKTVGKVEPDPRTGRLVATFDELPRLPYEHFALTLREGQRSTLVSPSACGSYPSDLSLASWAEPAVFQHEASAFTIAHGEAGGPCPSGGIPPFHPGLTAGSIDPQAGAYTPFYLRMTRNDGEQEITSYSATFPLGLLARIAGISTCPDEAIEAAKRMSGFAEQASPSCPASSQIGHTIAGYGVGGILAWAPGNVYLGGPYRGAPLSVVAITSALVGPFDLGVVVVHSAIRIDPRTAQISFDSSESDPIPHVLAGIPLHLRDIRVYLDRPDFMLNPTSCDPMQISSVLGGSGADLFDLTDDTTATSSQRFQVLNCSLLGFKPKLAFRLKGGTKRGALPSMYVTYTPRPGDANVKAVAATLPPSLFVEQGHIGTICTRVQFREESCPAGSVFGSARVTLPLTEEPLEGPVYLRASDHQLPDLVASLHSRVGAIEMVGRIDSSHEAVRTTFEDLPDSPVTSFTMIMPGGKRGLLVNAADLCASPQRANARLVAHDNATAVLHPVLKAQCRRRGKGHKSRGRRRQRLQASHHVNDHRDAGS